MIMSDAFSYVNALDCAADASWRRQTLILNNLANEDTPGYKRKDIEFASVLKRNCWEPMKGLWTKLLIS